jgi:hypothetical protein
VYQFESGLVIDKPIQAFRKPHTVKMARTGGLKGAGAAAKDCVQASVLT